MALQTPKNSPCTLYSKANTSNRSQKSALTSNWMKQPGAANEAWINSPYLVFHFPRLFSSQLVLPPPKLDFTVFSSPYNTTKHHNVSTNIWRKTCIIYKKLAANQFRKKKNRVHYNDRISRPHTYWYEPIDIWPLHQHSNNVRISVK